MFVHGLAAARALELDCNGMLLPSVPETVKRWPLIGAVPGIVDGWKVPKGTVPFVLHRIKMDMLKERAYASLDR